MDKVPVDLRIVWGPEGVIILAGVWVPPELESAAEELRRSIDFVASTPGALKTERRTIMIEPFVPAPVEGV